MEGLIFLLFIAFISSVKDQKVFNSKNSCLGVKLKMEVVNAQKKKL